MTPVTGFFGYDSPAYWYYGKLQSGVGRRLWVGLRPVPDLRLFGPEKVLNTPLPNEGTAVVHEPGTAMTVRIMIEVETISCVILYTEYT